MIRNNFNTKEEAENYLKIEKKLAENKQSALSYSERQKIKNNEIKPETLIVKKEKSKIPIITNIKELKKPCIDITKEDNIKEIIQKLKDTLECYEGYALSAPQIGIYKKISYCKIPYYNQNNKKLEEKEVILINPQIIEQDRKIIVKQEGCLSIPNLRIDTDRWVFITLINYNEKLEPQTLISQDLEGLIFQHEIDHLNGILIINRKHKAK